MFSPVSGAEEGIVERPAPPPQAKAVDNSTRSRIESERWPVLTSLINLCRIMGKGAAFLGALIAVLSMCVAIFTGAGDVRIQALVLVVFGAVVAVSGYYLGMALAEGVELALEVEKNTRAAVRRDAGGRRSDG